MGRATVMFREAVARTCGHAFAHEERLLASKSTQQSRVIYAVTGALQNKQSAHGRIALAERTCMHLNSFMCLMAVSR